MDPNNKEFKKLQAQWYAKLARKGFEDIESRPAQFGDQCILKEFESSKFYNRNRHIDSFIAQEEYFRLAGQFLHEYKFKSKFEQKIWRMHCEGLGLDEIVTIINTRRERLQRTAISLIIKRLSKVMLALVRKNNNG